MRPLKQHQIKQQQLKFLETSGPSLADYAETKLYPQKIKTSPATLIVKTIGNLKIKWIKNAGNDSNSNLIAFVYVLLHRAYSIRIQQNLLALIKSTCYNHQLDLTTLKSQLMANLSNSQIKKLLVQFFYLLSYSFFDDKIEAKLSKYPIIMNIFVVCLRKILANLAVKGAEDLQQSLQTVQIYQILSQYFNLSHQVQQNCYIFPQVHMVAMCLQPSQYQLGLYTSQDFPNIKVSQMAKMSIGTMDHSPKSQENLDCQAKTQKRPFFPKKSRRNPSQILKDSIKTFESLKDFNQSQAKKVKSLKENGKRKYSNSQQGSLLKEKSTLKIQKDSKTCDCQGRKKSNMTIISNIYQFNVKFVKISSQNSNVACYMSSKGLNCQLFGRNKNEENSLKTKFVYKKRFQTEQLHIPNDLAALYKKEDTAASNRLNETNKEFLRKKYVQKYIPSNPEKPRLFQNRQVPSFLTKTFNSSSSFAQKPQCLPINSFDNNRDPTSSPTPKQREL